MTVRARAALVAAALLGSARAVGAQDPAPAGPAVMQLAPGHGVLVGLATHETIRGRVLSVSRDTLVVATGDSARRVPVLDIASLRERRRNAKTGFIIGGATGVVVGALLGIIVAEVGCESADGCDTFGTAAACAGIGLGVVGGAGALVGQAIPSWTRRYP